MEDKKQKLGTRKKITLWLLILMVKIVEPMEYGHQYDAELKSVKDLIKDL